MRQSRFEVTQLQSACNTQYVLSNVKKHPKGCFLVYPTSEVVYNVAMPRLQTIEQRLDNYIDKTGDCWLWTIGTFNYGYGRLSIQKGKQVRAHRFIYEMVFGKIPDGLNVLHKCDNPRCVKPKHLYLGTQKDNVADMMNRKRGGYKKFCGESHHNSKLRRKDINEIKSLWEKGGLLQREIAEKFNISQQVVSKIVNNKAWLEDGVKIISNLK